MFDNLIASTPQHGGARKTLPSALTSVSIHGGIIWLAVVATIKTAEVIEEAQADTTMIFLTQEAKTEDQPAPIQEILSIDPPPKGFQVLVPPINIPTEIPPVDLSERFDPRDFSGIGVEGGVFSGVVGGTGPVDFTQTFLEAAVDERPERLSGPYPRYPEMLRQAGIEGFVLLEFVIDTSGHVEEGSLKVLQSTNRAFEGPAKIVIRRSLYRPGRVRGQAVRVLVSQRIGFTISR